MTTFVYTLTDEKITMKNNMNNVQEGHYIKVTSDNNLHSIFGIVGKITHLISQHHNKNGLERSTHDLVIEINPKSL